MLTCAPQHFKVLPRQQSGNREGENYEQEKDRANHDQERSHANQDRAFLPSRQGCVLGNRDIHEDWIAAGRTGLTNPIVTGGVLESVLAAPFCDSIMPRRPNGNLGFRTLPKRITNQNEAVTMHKFKGLIAKCRNKLVDISKVGRLQTDLHQTQEGTIFGTQSPAEESRGSPGDLTDKRARDVCFGIIQLGEMTEIFAFGNG